MKSVTFITATGVLSLSVALAGCDTEAFCFAECEDGATSTTTTAGGGNQGGGFNVGGSTGSFSTGSQMGGGPPCMPSNGGIEICDTIDNDCNGQIDDIPGIDYNAPDTCGTCSNNCFAQLVLHDPATISCIPSQDPGNTPGTCQGDCLADQLDCDADPNTCETFCNQTAQTDTLCNNKDDDCDCMIDDDVDFCSAQSCGFCGNACLAPHAFPVCEKTNMDPTCTANNTQCAIPDNTFCEPGWHDLDGLYNTGCEYACTITGPEVCGDQLDNDCDGLVDGADDLSMDPNIGVVCFGDPDGECALPAHAGITACTNGQVVCGGANVLFENDQVEMCDSIDNDCDGLVDDSPLDAGGGCGVSNIFPCTFGTFQCNAGGLVCVGAINPGTETCNGIDDNCDGAIDLAAGLPPADSIGACNVPVPPPPGATSPCMPGMRACVGGSVQCQGSVGPTSGTDTCGVDANCDGSLNNQPDLQTSTANCGTCGNNCMAGAVNAIWTCVAGGCQFQGCLPGWHDLNNDQQCEYNCTVTSSVEACNGQDDNCNGVVDEGVVAPSPTQVCGVSPAASRPECTTQVSVSCVAGNWSCGFPAGVCGPSCAAATEVCDGLDNDCDGFLNENVGDFGQACASDDGLPAPGHGACRTTGVKVCNGPGATTCSAMQANCASLPGGCTEVCDGIDNDCDGSVDEPFTAKGTNTANFVRPSVARLASGTFIHQFEASRPTATNVVPGSGNGFWTSAPAGTTLDRTPACSATNKLPWFNVTPVEAQQTCAAMGGFVCSNTNWKDACRVTPAAGADCVWGYSPTGASCTSPAVLPPAFNPPYLASHKFCNLGYFDFNTTLAGDQDGLLPTASSRLNNCSANWSSLSSNPANTLVADITGNLREITLLSGTTFVLMGGAFNSQAETGSTCEFDFYAVQNTFKLYDTGFRCCFASDPRL